MRMPFRIALAAMPLCLALAACSSGQDATVADAQEAEGAAEAPASFPESLAAFGDGYPNTGDACRKLGESELTSKYLDDSAFLIGCPTKAAAEALGGKVLETIEGITLVSVPAGEAMPAMSSPVAGPAPVETEDALVSGTDYNATAQVPCGFGGKDTTARCDAGVKRKWGEDGTTLVEITKPDGRKRAIFFQGTKAYGADSAQADGSAGWDFKVTRNGDESLISYGPESYVIPDALVVGG